MTERVATPVIYRLVVYRGQNLQDPSFTIKDSEGNLIDLTGCEGEIAIALTRQDLIDGEYLFHTSTEDSTPYLTLGDEEGTWSPDIPKAELEDLDPTGEGYDYDEYYWWGRLLYSDGTTYEIMAEGPCEVK